MVLPHNDHFLVVNLDLNWIENEQEDIILRLYALTWKQQTRFAGYRETVMLLAKIERQADNHNHKLQEEIIVARNPSTTSPTIKC